jgi:hypothetical protein
MVTQILHIITELSTLFISKICINDINILSKSFPLPQHTSETLQPSQHVWPPLKFSIKPDDVPHAIYTPATIEVHCRRNSRSRDMELGILEQMPSNEPTVGQHCMVVMAITVSPWTWDVAS